MMSLQETSVTDNLNSAARFCKAAGEKRASETDDSLPCDVLQSNFANGLSGISIETQWYKHTIFG